MLVPKSESIPSGVFWIKCPPDSGHLTFQSPHYFSQYNEVISYTKEFRDQTISHPTYNVFSEEGRMIIFPSSLSKRARY